MSNILITGITGQLGSYLAESLVKEGHNVSGMVRRSANPNYWRLKEVINDISLVEADMTDSSSLESMLQQTSPDYIFNLAANSFVKSSFSVPITSIDINGIGPIKLLEAARIYAPQAKIYQSSTSELFGSNSSKYFPQNEDTPFMPASPYALGKCLAYYGMKHYRKAYGLQTYNGIFFNFESPRRGYEFVTRKVSYQVSEIKQGKREYIELGNLNASRDWGHAKIYSDCVWKFINQEKLDTIVIGTGETHTVRELAETAFDHVGIKIRWVNSGENEVGYDERNIARVRVNPEFYRPNEVSYLLADSQLAQRELQWNPNVIDFRKLIQEMVDYDMYRVEKNIVNEF